MCRLHDTQPPTNNQPPQAEQGAEPRDGVAGHVQDVISLDLITDGNISKQQVCPKSRGSFVGVWVHESKLGQPTYRGVRTNLTCKQWNCPVCGERNKALLMARLWEGDLVKEALDLERQGVRYALKHLTLTLPGNSWRVGKSPERCVEYLTSNLNRLLTAIKAVYGCFHYFWVMEWKGGFPHLHVVLVGKAIRPRDLLEFVKKLWCGRYGMGFVKLRTTRREYRKELGEWITLENSDVKGSVGYLCKYLGKDLVGNGVHGKHHFGSSRYALARIAEVRPKSGYFLMGQISGRTIQEDEPGVKMDGQTLFMVLGAAKMYEEIGKLVEAGVWDRGAQVFKGSVTQDVKRDLDNRWGKGAVLPRVRIKKVIDGE